jgi:hypothetical protein
MIWGMFAVTTVLEASTDPHQQTLGTRYRAYWNMLVQNALPIFYVPARDVVRAVVSLKSLYLPVAQNTYTDADPNGSALDDPYEGELFVVFVDLFADWSAYGPDAKENMWFRRRALFQSIDMSTAQGVVTVQKGWWFSSHEQWKTWTLPYQDTYARAVFRNGEAVRTAWSSEQRIPGLFASVANTQLPSCPTYGGYVNSVGIAAVAHEFINCTRLVTPYAAAPMLADPELRSIGLVWYAHMLNGTRMQGPYGSTEASDVSVDSIANVLTWDSKINSVIAMLDAGLDITRKGMHKAEVYVPFVERINREYTRVFPSLQGEKVPLSLPTVPMP